MVIKRNNLGRFIKGTQSKTTQFKKGQPSWNKGKKMNLKVSRKGKTMIEIYGKKKAQSMIKKMSISKKGKLAHNKGIPMTSKQKLKISDSRKGIPAWNKGMETPNETKIKLSNSKKEYYKKHPEAIKYWFENTRKSLVMPIKDTKIEVKIQDVLRRNKIKFDTHKRISNIKYPYQCDVLIPTQKGISKTTVIECDGDYWHGNLKKFNINKLSNRIKAARCLDYERTSQMQEKGYNVVRLWEHKINKMDDKQIVGAIQC